MDFSLGVIGFCIVIYLKLCILGWYFGFGLICSVCVVVHGNRELGLLDVQTLVRGIAEVRKVLVVAKVLFPVAFEDIMLDMLEDYVVEAVRIGSVR